MKMSDPHEALKRIEEKVKEENLSIEEDVLIEEYEALTSNN